jgi:hypothetical protein
MGMSFGEMMGRRPAQIPVFIFKVSDEALPVIPVFINHVNRAPIRNF